MRTFSPTTGRRALPLVEGAPSFWHTRCRGEVMHMPFTVPRHLLGVGALAALVKAAAGCGPSAGSMGVPTAAPALTGDSVAAALRASGLPVVEVVALTVA